MAEKFKEEFGSEIYDVLPEAVWELSGGRKSANRILLHDFWQRLFNTAFLKNVGEWCGNNGIMLTGHMMREETLAGQTNGNGEVMPAYRYMDLPGMDMFANNYHYTCAKQVQSIVHQDGKEGMTSELYGVSNWNYDFRGHKNQGDWQAALGVTIRVPHLAPVSMKGSAKRDYPQFFSYQSPWYERYSYMENHFARLNTALTRGKAVVKVGVIHPIESCHMNYGPNDKTSDHIKGLDAIFKNVCEWLLEGQIDFDYISESELPNMLEEVSDFLEVGQMKYSAVVVAGCETLRQTTLNILKKLYANGGKVVCAGAAPQYLNGIKSSEPNEFFNETVHVKLDKYSLINALESERLIKITESDMSLSNDCVYQLRMDNSCLWLFIAPMKRLNSEHKNDVVVKQRMIRIKGEYTPVIYDTLSGETNTADFDVKLDGTEKTITSPTFKRGFGDVSSLGMPFYGGTLRYAMDIIAPEDCDAYLTLSSFAAPCAAVILDGEDIGTIAFSPYKIKLKNLKKGKHRLEFIVYGNRHNSFGALHMVTFEEVYINSCSWNFETDDKCNYKYEYELRRFGIIASPKIEYIKTF